MQGLLAHTLEYRYHSMCIRLVNSVERIPNIQEKPIVYDNKMLTFLSISFSFIWNDSTVVRYIAW